MLHFCERVFGKPMTSDRQGAYETRHEWVRMTECVKNQVQIIF